MLKYSVLTLGPLGAPIHPVLLLGGGARVLFDAGYPGQADEIERELNRAGLGIRDLSHVILSHHDHDHVGSLAELKERNPGLIAAASAAEAPFISGASPSLRLLQAERYNEGLSGEDRERGEAFAAYLKTIRPASVDLILGAGEAPFLPGLEIVPTPGHCPGHISLYLREAGLLLAGDALVFEAGKLGIANPSFTLDLPRAVESARMLLGLGARSIVCYHGGEADPRLAPFVEPTGAA